MFYTHLTWISLNPNISDTVHAIFMQNVSTKKKTKNLKKKDGTKGIK